MARTTSHPLGNDAIWWLAEEPEMITHVQTVGINVSDQQKALEWYTSVLGCEVIRDEPMGPDSRWIQVAFPGAQTHLVLFTPPGLEDRIGTFSGIVFTSDDLMQTYEDLAARGVEWTEVPNEQPWGGTMGQFKDLDGNTYVIHD